MLLRHIALLWVAIPIYFITRYNHFFRDMKRFFTFLCAALCCCWVVAQTRYIDKVYDYRPAPGQFIGEHYPDIYPGDTHETVVARVDSTLRGASGDAIISLGAWGGSITFGFDHDVANISGARDFVVYGNVYLSGQILDGHAVSSSEPGVIWVSADANGNGEPDDPWYEIAGSESSRTIRNMEMTYYYSTGDIRWVDNQGNEGVIMRNPWHEQESYFPAWEGRDSLVVSGSYLPANLYDSGNGSMRSICFDYGYADNQPNDSAAAGIDIDWAIDEAGNPVHLAAIRFVRVQTGIQVDWGISGEMSTEVCGAADLHCSTETLSTETKGCKKLFKDGQILIVKDGIVVDVFGRTVTSNVKNRTF